MSWYSGSSPLNWSVTWPWRRDYYTCKHYELQYYRNGSSGQLCAEITNTDLVAAKFEIQKAKTKISSNITISHYIVPARVGNIWSLTVIREVLQNWWKRWVHKPRSHYSFILWQPWYQYFFCPCFAHVGPRARFTPPTLSSIPFTCTHWIQNPNNACAWTDTKFCHKTWFITNATKTKAQTQILITRHICKIVTNNY